LEQDLESPALFFEPAAQTPAPAPQPSDPAIVSISNEQTGGFTWPADTGIQIIRATCAWIQYGTVGFAAFCILIGALEGILGR
jgi:hypothetical protein